MPYGLYDDNNNCCCAIGIAGDGFLSQYELRALVSMGTLSESTCDYLFQMVRCAHACRFWVLSADHNNNMIYNNKQGKGPQASC